MFANMIRGGAATLSANRQLVNDLNVFPIPDGDTGDNMFMTIDSGVAALCNDEYPSLSTSASIAAQGMLLGARGNSGVILSRIFAGISRGLEGVEQADVTLLDKDGAVVELHDDEDDEIPDYTENEYFTGSDEELEAEGYSIENAPDGYGEDADSDSYDDYDEEDMV